MSTRKVILEQLARGEIDAAQASALLDRSSTVPPVSVPAPGSSSNATPATRSEKPGMRWLRIHVSELESGRSRVRVNVPLGLVQFGLRVGARFTDEVNSDLIQDVMEVLKDQSVSGTLVEVEDMDDNERVHIYVD